MSGQLQTVTGPVPQGELGTILCHEHLFNDLTGVVDAPSFEFSKVLAGRLVRPDLQWALRQDPYCCADNMGSKAVDDVVSEVQSFAALGGRTIVDATGSSSIGRSPEKLLAVAERTGLNIVMSTGPYLEKFEGERITARTVDAQASDIDDDLNRGVGHTGIRAGMIGEVGVSPSFTEAERGALRAAAIAQTGNPGVALNIHMPGWQRRGHEVLDVVLDECGVKPVKVSLAHSDPSGADPDYQMSLLDRGVWLEFDMIGLDITFPGEGVSPSVSETVAAVKGLIDRGYGPQLLLSSDLFLKQMWTKNGGNGFAFVPTVFIELLQAQGVAATDARALVTVNPAAALAG